MTKHFNKSAPRPAPEFEIFVDLDGVLSDFDSHAKAHGKYDDKGETKWDSLDLEWWVTMPAYPGAWTFYDGLRKLGGVRILTAPVPQAACFAGKAQWLENERGHFALLGLIICRASDKAFLARPNHILIDDREKNIREWVAAGGIGIHHKGDYRETIAAVEKAIDDYRQKNVPPAPSAPKIT